MTKILIIEDVDDFRKYLISIMPKSWEICEASSYEEGEKKIAVDYYNIIFIDYGLQGFTGDKLIHTARLDIKNFRSLLIGISSCYDNNMKMESCGANWSYTKGEIIDTTEMFLARVMILLGFNEFGGLVK